MKRIILLSILSILVINTGYTQDQSKNIFDVSAGFAPAIMDIYFDMLYNFLPNRELSPVYHLFYARQVRIAVNIRSILTTKTTVINRFIRTYISPP